MKNMFRAVRKIACTVFVLSLFVCFFSSCGKGEKMPLGDWQVVSFEKDGIFQTIAIATLRVENAGKSEAAVSGFSGVNNFFGTFSVSKDGIKPLDDFGSTLMAGPDEAMEFEADFMALISTADSWKTYKEGEMDFLEISSSEKNSKAKFMKIRLVGSSWKLSAMNTGDALVSSDSDIFIAFETDEKINGNTGVNTINFGYKADFEKHKIKFSEGMMTRAAGSPTEMETESLFLQNLLTAASYSVTGETLVLWDSEGNALLEFEKTTYQ